MEQKPHLACETRKSKQKTIPVTFKLTTRSDDRLSLQTFQWCY